MPLSIAFCRDVEISEFHRAISEFNQTWAVIQSLHLIAMATLVASITAFDLRLLGLAMKRVPISRLGDRLLPATWFAFGLLILTGGTMFVEKAISYCQNWVFLAKMVLILVAGVNMAVFQFSVYWSGSKWDKDAATPLSAKLAGSISVLLWAGVVVAGRWIGFV